MFASFEEIGAWQKARELVRRIYAATGRRPFADDFGLRDQIQKAGVSIMSNIAEGFERGGRKEFLRFLSIAKGSAGETRSHLYVAIDQGYIAPDVREDLFARVQEVSRMTAGLMSSLRRRISAKRDATVPRES
jgi:four helix bundle protein